MVSLVKHNSRYILFSIFFFYGCGGIKNNTISPYEIQAIVHKKYITSNAVLDRYSKLLDRNQSSLLEEKLDNKNHNNVISLILKGSVLYLKIKYFSNNSDSLIRESVLKYRSTLKGIILDLRDSPGGLLAKAISISDYFVDDTIVLKAIGRSTKDTNIYRTYTRNTLTDVPIVVLVNKNTISASEVLAGILQHQKRAILIGEKTFGKRTIQELIAVDDNRILKLTTQRYYFVPKRDREQDGLLPNIMIKNEKIYKNSNVSYILKRKIKNINAKNRDFTLLVAKTYLDKYEAY